MRREEELGLERRKRAHFDSFKLKVDMAEKP